MSFPTTGIRSRNRSKRSRASGALSQRRNPHDHRADHDQRVEPIVADQIAHADQNAGRHGNSWWLDSNTATTCGTT